MNAKERCQTLASLHWKMPRQANRLRSIRQTGRHELFLQISSLDLKPSFRAHSGRTMLTRSHCKPAKITSRHCARFLNNANAGSGFDNQSWSNGVMECWSKVARASALAYLGYFASGDACATLAAEEFHDIAPPVDYSLIPPWLVFVIAFVVLSLLG